VTEIDLFKIGEVAKLLSTSIRTIRYYEEEGLIDPVRTEKGTRLYAKVHIDRLAAILKLANNGFPIEEINNLAHIREQHTSGDKSQKALSEELDEWSNEITSKIGGLQKVLKEIQDTKKTIVKCSGCKNQPTSKGCPECPVKDYLHDIELLNLIWDQEV